MTSNASMTSVL